jgi:hypothetical protein
MNTYRIVFTHTEETEYEIQVEATSQEEAEEVFEDDPFGCDENMVTSSAQGLDIELILIEEV